MIQQTHFPGGGPDNQGLAIFLGILAAVIGGIILYNQSSVKKIILKPKSQDDRKNDKGRSE